MPHLTGQSLPASAPPNSDLPFLVTHWLSQYGDGPGLGQGQGRNIDQGQGQSEVTSDSALAFHTTNADSRTVADINAEDALRRIRQATNDLAAAFSDLGAYGVALRSPLALAGGSVSIPNSNLALRNANYTDVTRRWNNVPNGQLETLVATSNAVTEAVLHSSEGRSRGINGVAEPISALESAYELERKRNQVKLAGGIGGAGATNNAGNGSIAGDAATSILGDNAMSVEQQEEYQNQEYLASSLLQRPVLLQRSNNASTSTTSNNATMCGDAREAGASALVAQNNHGDGTGIGNDHVIEIYDDKDPDPSTNGTSINLTISSDFNRVETLAAQAMRRYLNIQNKFQEEERTIRQISRSLEYRKRFQKQVDEDISNLLMTSSARAAGASGGVVSESIGDQNLQENREEEERMEQQRLKSAELAEKKLDNERVIAQLTRRLGEINTIHDNQTTNEFQMAKSVAEAFRRESLSMKSTYTDPTGSATSGFHDNWKIHGPKANTVLNFLTGREFGTGLKMGRKGPARRRMGVMSIPSHDSLKLRNKNIFLRRLSHVVTINTHLFYPVYCLRFDRTGRYFITGADDSLVKLFRIGTNARARRKSVYSASAYSYQRGAILVCTLRGHAGVITDIDVSCDNALVATASEDGDVRVWGMTNGCPVAILRGHEGGANMVSWSSMTPYQLVSVGQDGLARIWDIREAALKRCVSIRERNDYSLPVLKAGNEGNESHSNDNTENGSEDVLLPPLPPSGARNNEANQNMDQVEDQVEAPAVVPAVVSVEAQVEAQEPPRNGSEIVVPPLPPGAEIGIGAERHPNGNQNGAPVAGAFVANSEIDEGVKLLSRLLHGDPDDQFLGAGTRQRRKKVKVICLARCPIGGHFATGSDDGIGRIWLDHDDSTIDKQDETMFEDNNGVNIGSTNLLRSERRDSLNRTRGSSRGNSNAPSTTSLLAHLHGHINDITDVEYSRMGDRLLTASQKDGVVRIWSWGTETAKAPDGTLKMDHIKQVYVRLEPPLHLQKKRKSNSSSGPSNRRRGGSSESQKSSLIIHCDVAKWTADDTKIITSQTCVEKHISVEIVPGTHIIYVWDSILGTCLIGLPSAHEKACPVLFSHPFDSSMIVSAGLDGSAKVWDLDSGKAIFSHQNTHQYGAVENLSDRGKKCGYLDGCFSPDGLHMILTDDSGRITIVDVLGCEDEIKTSRVESAAVSAPGTGSSADPIILSDNAAPKWLHEQYFANDYYELFYDSSGYCIERGCRLPPHLAPEAARCNHTGSPFPDSMQCKFSGLLGPIPTLESDVVIGRNSIRSCSSKVREHGILSQNVYGKRNLIEARATKSSHLVLQMGLPSSRLQRSISASSAAVSPVRAGNSTLRTGQTSRRERSSNYRWIGFDEALREEVASDEADSDDEEYEEGARIQEDDEQEIWGRRRRNDTSASTSRSRARARSETSIRARARTQNSNSRNRRRQNNSNSRNRRQQNNSNSRNRRRQNRNRNRLDEDELDEVMHDEDEDEDNDELEEILHNEPSRMSARQLSQRVSQQYQSESSEDEELEELLSANTRPSGEYITDYTELDHLFKLPQGGSICRSWLTRDSCILGYTGWKSYLPQVGDSVIYIPKAHSEILKAYPACQGAGTASPWQLWPRSSSWPVVECKITSIRYRFPYKEYYGSRARNIIHSAVAILTLELTGIPIHVNDRTLPWSLPQFVPKPSTRSNSGIFEVSLFESAESSFIVPAALYKWRLQRLEQAVMDSGGDGVGVEIIDFYVNTDDDDTRFDPFQGKLISTGAPENERETHFQNSGFNSVEIEYDSGDFSIGSAWGFALRGEENSCPLPSCLTDTQKRAFIEIIDSLETDQDVRSIFSAPADTRIYVDYFNMIEIPMDTSMVRKRLEHKYYTNVESVRADMKLIVDNCLKYNKPGTDISDVAVKMFADFNRLYEEKMEHVSLDPAERPESDRPHIGVPGRISSDPQEPQGEDSGDNMSNGGPRNPSDEEPDESVLGSRRALRAQQRGNRRIAEEDHVDPRNPSDDEEPDESVLGSRRALRAQQRGNRRISEEDHADPRHPSDDEEPDENALRSGRALRAQQRGNRRFAEEEHVDSLSSGYLMSTRRQPLEDAAIESHDEEPVIPDIKIIIDADEYIASSDSDSDEEKNLTERAAHPTRRSLRVNYGYNDEEESPDQNVAARSQLRPRIRISARNQRNTQSQASVDSDGDELDIKGCMKQDESNDEEEEESVFDEEESPEKNPPETGREGSLRSCRRTTRASIQSSGNDSYASSEEEIYDEEESEDDEDEHNKPPARDRATRRSRPIPSPQSQPQAKKRKLRSVPTSPPSPPRRSSRTHTVRNIAESPPHRTSRHFRNNRSALETLPSTRSTSGTRSALENLPPGSPGAGLRSSPRRRAASTTSYHDYSDSNISVNGSEDDQPVFTERPRRKRTRIEIPKPASPKRKKKPKKRIEPQMPQLEKWPGHAVKPDQLFDVCLAIVERVRSFDADGVFHLPVLESFPGIADRYRKKVQNPIDLRTIRNDCIESYQVIGDLQEDLIRMFKNCCTYHPKSSSYFKYSVNKWENLNAIFVDVLKENRIDLPRRFTS
eukprot:CAMPEP_0194125116 /NCGR_PEP_ID=MMETSP0150-20130528/59296_1 /TAXON_ID=122233 /ORGANISM="Chaetoceros debilis, Strain MM31A-1" /LENGTH=2581 /DNA_ID=CAMNT_0038818909 /DNA_START=110 /DNA_END=7855 /DNA_ORIENTATION=-